MSAATLEGLLDEALAMLDRATNITQRATERMEEAEQRCERLTGIAGLAIRQSLARFNASPMSISSVDKLRADLMYVADKLDGAGQPYSDATAKHSVKVTELRSVPEVEPA